MGSLSSLKRRGPVLCRLSASGYLSPVTSADSGYPEQLMVCLTIMTSRASVLS